MSALLRFKDLDSETKAVVVVISQVFFWGLLPIASKFALLKLPALFVLAVMTLLASMGLFVFIVLKGEFYKLSLKRYLSLGKEVWLSLLFNTFGYHTLLLLALEFAHASEVSVLATLEVFFTYLIFTFAVKEKSPVAQMIGAVLIVLGSVIITFKAGFDSLENMLGWVLITVGAFIAPIGNYFQKKLLQKVETYVHLFWRGVLGGAGMLLASFIISPSNIKMEYIAECYGWILVGGLLCMCLAKLMFLYTMNVISVSKTITLASASPGATLIYAYYILGEDINIYDWVGFISCFIGVSLVSLKGRSES